MDSPSGILDHLESYDEKFHSQALLYSVELFFFFLATTLTRWLVLRYHPKARNFSSEQERVVFSAPAILLLKGYIGIAAAREYYHANTPIGQSQLSGVLAQRFNMWLPMCFGYAFELVHRPLPLGLVFHHAGSQIATYLWWCSALSRPQPVMFAFSEMFLTIFIYGIGLHGGAAEMVGLIRQLAPEKSRTSRLMTKALAKSVWLSFAWQWTTIGRLVVVHRACLAESLTVVERAVWTSCFLVFIVTQIGSIRSMNVVARKSWGSVEQPEWTDPSIATAKAPAYQAPSVQTEQHSPKLDYPKRTLHAQSVKIECADAEHRTSPGTMAFTITIEF